LVSFWNGFKIGDYQTLLHANVSWPSPELINFVITLSSCLWAYAASFDQTCIHSKVMFLDGCGLLHPRRFGSACQLGVEGDLATVGVSKNLYAIEGLDRAEVEAAFVKEAATEVPSQQLNSHQQTGGRLGRDCVQQALVAASGASGHVKALPSGHRIRGLHGASGELLGAAICRRESKTPLYVSIGKALSSIHLA
jgi:deoxyinosine 3'endonuclease (endonuclease V)